MASVQVRRVRYSGEIWSGSAVNPELWAILNQKDTLIELETGQPPYQVVIGVPHHAAPGVPRIAENWTNPRTSRKGRPADETTGLTGLTLFSALRDNAIPCKLVIAAHPTDHDPNKSPGSPYWQSIFSEPHPELLFELHGAGKNRRYALELSAGKNDKTEPLAFGRILIRYLKNEGGLAVQIRPGTSEARLFKPDLRDAEQLENPALGTPSLEYAGQIGVRALHMEMKSELRQPDPTFPDAPRPSLAARRLAQALAMTFRAEKYPGGIYIPAADLGLKPSAYLTAPSPHYEESFMKAVGEIDADEFIGLDDLLIRTHEGFMQIVANWDEVEEDGLPPKSDEDPPLIEEILWLIDQGEFIGRVYFFHWLTEFRRQTDGQVDYWIRPSRRGQGYGKLILRLTLERFRQLGSKSILITCNSDNAISARIIEANGGVFESEIPDDLSPTGLRRRYWITL
jgi:predicted acetyltransferase